MWTTTANRRSAVMPMRMTIEKFLSLEDKDLQNYMYMEKSIAASSDMHEVDNDEKYGIYFIESSIRRNNKGTYYKNSRLMQWMVYNKSTKKVTLSGSKDAVVAHLIAKVIGSPGDRMWHHLLEAPTKTLCKKLIEGKINTIGDLIDYHISYTIRDKRITRETAVKFFSIRQIHTIHVFEDPNEVAKMDNLDKIIEVLPNGFLVSRPFKIKTENINNIYHIYKEWYEQQSEKYDRLSRLGNGKVRDNVIQDNAY